MAAVRAAAETFGGSETSLQMFCDLERPPARDGDGAPVPAPHPLRLRAATSGGADDDLWTLEVEDGSGAVPLDEPGGRISGARLGDVAADAARRFVDASRGLAAPWRATLALVCGATSPGGAGGGARAVFQASFDRHWALGSARTDWNPSGADADAAAWVAGISGACARALRVFEAFEEGADALRRGTLEVRVVALAPTGVRRVFAGRTARGVGAKVNGESFVTIHAHVFDAEAAAASRACAEATLRALLAPATPESPPPPEVHVDVETLDAGEDAGWGDDRRPAAARRRWVAAGRLADGEAVVGIKVVVGPGGATRTFAGVFPGSVDPAGVDPLAGTLSRAPLEALREWRKETTTDARRAAGILFDAWAVELCATRRAEAGRGGT